LALKACVPADIHPGEAMSAAPRVRSLYDHAAFVTRTLRSFGVPSRDVDDEVQRTFICAARRIDDIRPGTERSFLFSIATRMAAHARRSHERRREVLSGEPPEPPEPMEARVTPEHVAGQKQLCDVFERMLDGIEEPLRSVFTLHAFHELGARETAAALGIPPGTVASRLRRARAQLQARMAKLRFGPRLLSART
jgi:RNA polymerase sigma-70 factor, ECF subfamily